MRGPCSLLNVRFIFTEKGFFRRVTFLVVEERGLVKSVSLRLHLRGGLAVVQNVYKINEDHFLLWILYRHIPRHERVEEHVVFLEAVPLLFDPPRK